MKYLLWAREHGMTAGEYLATVTSRELTEQAALEKVFGPLGEERMDWRFAWLAMLWTVDKERKLKLVDYVRHFRAMLREAMETDGEEEHTLITDDPEASARKAKEIERTMRRWATDNQAGEPEETGQAD